MVGHQIWIFEIQLWTVVPSSGVLTLTLLELMLSMKLTLTPSVG